MATQSFEIESGKNGNSLSHDQMIAMIEQLRKENAQLKSQPKAAAPKLSLRVSEKGAISVYGLGRFPVTLYKNSMIRLLDISEQIQSFIKDNESSLATKLTA
jgi:hypothetical protein